MRAHRSFWCLLAGLQALAATSDSWALSLRFYGHGSGDIDRVKIPLDSPPRTVDVGGDFTLEWWLKANLADNNTPSCTTGNDNWITGNVVFDRDVFGGGDYGDYGISLRGGKVAFGVHNGTSGEGICGSTNVADGAWHHIAVTREASTGTMRIYVDGNLDGSGMGPTGDISYRDGRTTSYPNSDPYLVIGAEKHDAGPSYPSFNGWIDEVRLSSVVRYSSNFTPPTTPFSADGDTLLLFHFDEGTANSPCNGTVTDSSPGAQNPGQCQYGGSAPAGPVYSADTPFGPPVRDVVVLPRRPLSVRLPSSGQTVTKRMRVAVRNASESPGMDITVQLSATSDCPPGVLSSEPDFDPSTPVAESATTIAPKRTRKAVLSLSFDPNDFSTPNRLAPLRCRVSLSAVINQPSGATDPNPSNNAFDVEVNVVDLGDPQMPVVHENVLASLSPTTLRIRKNLSSKSKRITLRVTNADANEPAGDSLSVSVLSTDCPSGTVGAVDFDPVSPGEQNSVIVPGRKTRSGKVELNALAVDVATPSRLSPFRCVTRFGVVGPGSDPETTNNETELILDVYDANDF